MKIIKSSVLFFVSFLVFAVSFLGVDKSIIAEASYGGPSVPPASFPTCDAYDTVVNFDGSDLVSSTNESEATEVRSVSIPAGTYDVFLSGGDWFTNRSGTDSQPNESWKLVFMNGSTIVGETSSTPDIADGVDEASETLTVDNFSLSSDVDSVVAYHSVYPDASSPNSVRPICAGFSVVPPAPTYQCSDKVDNDGEGLIDELDPGCHTDGDPTNTSTYVPTDDDENDAPKADAGVDQNITLPTNSVNLDGSGSTDADGTITSYVWDFVSGPSTVDPDDVVAPSISGLVEGTYVFKLTVTDDDGATGEDTVNITINPEENHTTTTGSIPHKTTGSIPKPITPKLEPKVLGESCGLYLTTYMKLGSKSNDKEEVKKLQIFLNEYQNAGLVVDGIYGPKTFSAVKIFQVNEATEVLNPWVSSHHLQSDASSVGTGWMYKTTQRRINMIKCPELNLPMPILTIDQADLG